MKQDIKVNIIKARFIVIGLILIAIPHSLEQFSLCSICLKSIIFGQGSRQVYLSESK